MHACKLNVLADGVGHDFAVFGNGIHLDFLGMLDELAHHDRVFLRDVSCKLEEPFELVPVGTYVHRSPAEHV